MRTGRCLFFLSMFFSLFYTNNFKNFGFDCLHLLITQLFALTDICRFCEWQLVETVATCLIRIADSFSHSPELLDELCKHGVIHKSLHLIAIDGRMSLSQTTYTVCYEQNSYAAITCYSCDCFVVFVLSSEEVSIYLLCLQGLIGLLTKLASSSLVAVRTLFELNISSTLRSILMASDLSHGTPYSPFEDVQSNQVFMLHHFPQNLNLLINKNAQHCFMEMPVT